MRVKLMFLFTLLVVLIAPALMAEYPAGYFYFIFRGDTFCVEPVITDSVTESAWFDYTSSSMHTGHEVPYESHMFFFYNPLSGNIGYLIQHNIDVIGTADATCSLWIDFEPPGCSLAMSDDGGEFDLTDYPQGHWAWWNNTDGGAFFIPRDEWQFRIRTNFGSIDPIKSLWFISGDDGSEKIYLDTVYINQEDTLYVGHGFLQLLPFPDDTFYFDSVMVGTDTIIEIAVHNSDETIDTLSCTGASHTDPNFTTISSPGRLGPDDWGTLSFSYTAPADTGIYIDTVWAHTNEPCGTNPIILIMHVTGPPVQTQIIEPLPNTWTSCADQRIVMNVWSEGSICSITHSVLWLSDISYASGRLTDGGSIGYSHAAESLAVWGWTVDEIDQTEILTAAILEEYDIVVIGNVKTDGPRLYTVAERDLLTNFVNCGGKILTISGWVVGDYDITIENFLLEDFGIFYEPYELWTSYVPPEPGSPIEPGVTQVPGNGCKWIVGLDECWAYRGSDCACGVKYYGMGKIVTYFDEHWLFNGPWHSMDFTTHQNVRLFKNIFTYFDSPGSFITCDIDPASIVFSVNGVNFTCSDLALSYVGDSTLIYVPIPPDTLTDGDTVEVCLVEAANSCGGYLSNPVCWEFMVDLSPPYIVDAYPPQDTMIADPMPTISATVFDDGSGVDESTLELIVQGDTIDHADYTISPSGYGWNIVYNPHAPLIASDSIRICITGTDTTDYCDDNIMDTCWTFINMHSREVWFPTVYGSPCDTVMIPLLIDGLDFSWIGSATFTFRTDPAVLIPLDIILDSSLTDGWTVVSVSTVPDSGIIRGEIEGTPLTSGDGGDFLYLQALVECNAAGGRYCDLIIDTIFFNEGLPSVSYSPGIFIVELNPHYFTCDIRLNRTTGIPVDDFVVTFGAMASASDLYDPGTDTQHVPPPSWLVDGWFAIDDPSYPFIDKLTRDIRDVSPPKTWTLVTEDEPYGVAHWNPFVLPEGEFRINGLVDMKRDSVCYYTTDDTLFIEWYLPGLEPSACSMVPGWNMVSSPVLPMEVPANEVFHAEYGVFAYNSLTYVYEMAHLISEGEGYWVFCSDSMEFPIAGATIDGYRRQIEPGWNMIGAPNMAVAVDEIDLAPLGGIVGSIYYYDGMAYGVTDSLYPGKGYWLLSSEEGILHVPTGYRRRPEPSPLIEWRGLLISENTTLEIAYTEEHRNPIDYGDIALPPVPPNSDDRYAALIRDNIEFVTDISSQPSWELKVNRAIDFEISIPEEIILTIGDLQLNIGDNISLSPGIYKISANTILPEEFSVIGCRPNPFNAATELMVDIPKSGELDLQIYNISGKLVYSESRDYPAGRQTIRWQGVDDNSNQLPSGLYLARISFGEESQVTRAMLIK